MSSYSRKAFLRNTKNTLLQTFFEEEGVLSDFKWVGKSGDDKESPLPETEVDGLNEAIENLDRDVRVKSEQESRDITLLADDNIIFSMIDHGKKTRYGIDLASEFSENEIEGPFDKAMWVYINHNIIICNLDLETFVLTKSVTIK